MYQHPSISICQLCRHVMPWSQTVYGVIEAHCPTCHTTRPHDIQPRSAASAGVRTAATVQNILRPAAKSADAQPDLFSL